MLVIFEKNHYIIHTFLTTNNTILMYRYIYYRPRNDHFLFINLFLFIYLQLAPSAKSYLNSKVFPSRLCSVSDVPCVKYASLSNFQISLFSSLHSQDSFMRDCAMAPAVSRWFLTTATRFRTRVESCAICG